MTQKNEDAWRFQVWCLAQHCGQFLNYPGLIDNAHKTKSPAEFEANLVQFLRSSSLDRDQLCAGLASYIALYVTENFVPDGVYHPFAKGES